MKIILSFTVALLISISILSAKDFKVSAGKGELGKSQQTYSAAQIGTTYPLGWWARTGNDRLNVEFNTENIFRLLPNSELQISGEGAANGKFRRVLNLKSGSVELDLPTIKTTGSKVEVQTPTAICGAVGTRFTINAENGNFNVQEGAIYAKALGDATFEAKKLSGSFNLNPGKENTYVNGTVSGTFILNGQSYTASGLSLEVAKAKGGVSTAAVKFAGASLGGSGQGSYVMNGNKLEAVDPSLVSVHHDYLSASEKEGKLNLQRASLLASGRSVPPTLNAQLDQQAKLASELRSKLFNRRVIRDTAKETVRQIQSPAKLSRPNY